MLDIIMKQRQKDRQKDIKIKNEKDIEGFPTKKKQEQYSTQKRGFSEYLFTDGMTLQTSNNLSCLPKLSNPQSEQKINNIFLVEATLQFKLFVRRPSVSPYRYG